MTLAETRAAQVARAASLEALADAVVTADLDLRIVGWNPGAERLYGWRADEVLGRYGRDVLATEYYGTGESVLAHLFADGQWSGEVLQRTSGGERLSVFSSVTLLRDASGSPTAVVAVNRPLPSGLLAGHVDGALEAAETATFSWDPAADVFTWSANAPAVHGRSGALGVTSVDAYALVHPEDQDRILSATTKAIVAGSGYEIEYRVVGDEGDVRWLHCRGRVLRDEDTRVSRLLGTIVDVTERHRLEATLHEAQEQLNAVMSKAPIVLFAFDREGRATLVTGAGLPRTAGDGGEIVGRRVEDLAPGTQMVAECVARALAGESFRIDLELEDRLYDTWYQPLHDAAGEVVGGFSVATDVTDRRRAEVELAHKAVHDPLTGLPNRVLFLDRLTVALQRGKRRGLVTALLFLDLDRFKQVNDTYGHGMGDLVLRQAAARLASLVRPSDTIARFGGDEFVVLCEDLVGELEAVGIAERVVDGLRVPVGVGDAELRLSTSIGIAIAQGEGPRPEDLIREADVAMYRAKEQGRSCWELYDTAMRERAVEQLDIRHALLGAVGRGELRLHFQPAVRLVDGTLRGVEALVRWAHPERGIVAPGEFLPAAEEAGMMREIGEWVLRSACEQAGRWNRMVAPPLVVGVNLSGRQLADPQLVGDVARVLKETETDPSVLCLEIGEATLVDQGDAVVPVLQELRALGVRLAVDDFGAGHSALSSLAAVPADVLKLDRVLAHGAATGERGAAVVRAVVELGHALGFEVVAEGVETTGELDCMGELGCDLAQGFLVGRPAPDLRVAR